MSPATIKIGKRSVGPSLPAYIIAEAGVNHDGSVDKALKLVDAAVTAGADAVKFQTFAATDLLRRDAEKPEYQRRTTGQAESQFEMIRKLELSADAHARVARYCAEVGIDYMSTPYSEAAVAEVAAAGATAIKIASCDLPHGPMLLAAAKTGLPIILSTGAAEKKEIEAALTLLGTAGAKDVVVLQCTTSYPCPDEHANVAAMADLAGLGRPVGLSDHTMGITASIAARAMGACVLEKHFTLDRQAPGPDHAASLEPEELARYIAEVRRVERLLGSPTKTVASIEQDTRRLMRRSIVLSRSLRAGDVLRLDDLAFKRPGTGISPMEWRELLGRRLRRDIAADDALAWDDLEAGS